MRSCPGFCVAKLCNWVWVDMQTSFPPCCLITAVWTIMQRICWKVSNKARHCIGNLSLFSLSLLSLSLSISRSLSLSLSLSLSSLSLSPLPLSLSLLSLSLSSSLSVRGAEVKLSVVFEVSAKEVNHRQHCAFLISFVPVRCVGCLSDLLFKNVILNYWIAKQNLALIYSDITYLRIDKWIGNLTCLWATTENKLRPSDWWNVQHHG